MIDSKRPGDRIIKRRRPAARRSQRPDADQFVHTPAPLPQGSVDSRSHVTSGNVLWTLTHQNSTAQARRWMTPTGCELEMHIWTGARIEGQEDLTWSQRFPNDEALVEAALAKKRQLEAAGWLEAVDATPR
jgi:hypothetical protein